MFLLLVCLVGSLMDSFVFFLDGIFFPFGSLAPWSYPLWMSALWLSFGTTLNSSLRWLRGRLIVAMLLGAVGGPLAYYSADRFGAIEVGRPHFASYLIISLMWALITPVLVELSRQVYDLRNEQADMDTADNAD